MVDITAATTDSTPRARIIKERIEARKLHSQVRRVHRLRMHRRGRRTRVCREPTIAEVDVADLAVGSTLIRGSEWGLLWDAGFMGLTSYVPLLLDFAEASFGYLAYHVLLFACFMLSGIAALAL